MPARRKYPPELKQEAMRMVHDLRRRNGTPYGSVSKVSRELGVGRETLRAWIRQGEVDSGIRPGRSTPHAQRITALEKELAEVRRANKILLEAGGFIARALDPRAGR
ncbi:transposase [Streptomyces sp. NPDC051162]|uniref:transposase n=1 Tax=unclassified Streptomyces TaxID=2593676 RepID=UPI00343B13C7